MKTSRGQSGFTLIELLMVVSTIGVLGALGMQSYNLYKQRTYNTITEHSVHNIISAMAAGRIDNDFMDNFGFAWAWLDTAGVPADATARELLPGYVHPAGVQMWVWHDAWCSQGLLGEWCTIDMLSGRHCKGDKWYMFQRLRNGLDVRMEWAAVGTC